MTRVIRNAHDMRAWAADTMRDLWRGNGVLSRTHRRKLIRTVQTQLEGIDRALCTEHVAIEDRQPRA